MGEDPQLLTVLEVASALHISRQTVFRLLAVGQLPSIRIGRARRVSRQQLDAFIADLHRTGGTPSAWPGRADRTPKGGPPRQHRKAAR